jgi:23S rRNA pseudoU1915 N3-methylase RlmH
VIQKLKQKQRKIDEALRQRRRAVKQNERVNEVEVKKLAATVTALQRLKQTVASLAMPTAGAEGAGPALAASSRPLVNL